MTTVVTTPPFLPYRGVLSHNATLFQINDLLTGALDDGRGLARFGGDQDAYDEALNDAARQVAQVLRLVEPEPASSAAAVAARSARLARIDRQTAALQAVGVEDGVTFDTAGRVTLTPEALDTLLGASTGAVTA